MRDSADNRGSAGRCIPRRSARSAGARTGNEASRSAAESKVTAWEALLLCSALPGIDSVLDVGSGAGNHAHVFRTAGKDVTQNSYTAPADVVGDYLTTDCGRSEEHTSELQSLMRISYAVFCLKKKTNK